MTNTTTLIQTLTKTDAMVKRYDPRGRNSESSYANIVARREALTRAVLADDDFAAALDSKPSLAAAYARVERFGL